MFNFLFQSCDDNPNLEKNLSTENQTFLARKSDGESVGENVILGKKLINAYSISVMQEAFNYYNNLYPNSPFNGYIVKPTHKYIKIEPKTEQDLIYLEKIEELNDEIYLSNYPLDYEIIQEGSDYTDSTYTGKLEFKPLYTVIPIEETLDIPFSLIEEIYEPTEEEYDIETIALTIANWQDDLIADFDEEVTMSNINQFIEAPVTQSARLFGRRYRPKGTIQMFIYDTNNVEGLMNAKIRTGRNFFWKTTYTNEAGYFEASKKYRGKVRIRSAWRNNTATLRMSWNEMIGIQVSDHVMTVKRSNNNRTYIIRDQGEDVRLWCKGVIHNGIHKYNKYCESNGITKVMGANVWVGKNGGSACSTPMFKTLPTLPVVAAFSGTGEGNVLAQFSSSVLLSAFQLVSIPFNHLMPDQIYTQVNKRGNRFFGVSKSNRTVEQLVFHESGHFSHAKNVGANYYGKVVYAEMTNQISDGDPYVDGTKPSIGQGQLIALEEGWATFIENKCISHYYNEAYDDGFRQAMPAYMENYTMYSTPFTFTSRRDNTGWFLSGLMWDITDNQINENTSFRNGTNNQFINSIQDNLFISTNTGFLFNQLQGNVLNGTSLKNKMLQNYPSRQTEINQLFQSYGY